jgi:hypothetical protein
MLPRCGTAGALALALVAGAPQAAQAATTVPAAKIARELGEGHPFIKAGVIVRGRLDLSRKDTVARVFECHGCLFTDDVNASNVTFARTVDLSGSTFASSVDFGGATFAAPALFRSIERDRRTQTNDCADSGPVPTCFGGRADFSLAVFHDLASFDGSEFERTSSFRDTRFQDGTFSQTYFDGMADFDGAAFRGEALFNQAKFFERASLAGADFGGHTDFSLAHFDGGATFSGSQLAHGASFFAAEFTEPPGLQVAAGFQGVTTGADLNFTFSIFHPSEQGEATANFGNLVSGAALVLRELDHPQQFALQMQRSQVRDLSMDVADVQAVDAPNAEGRAQQQRRVLQTIEASAKARGDLAEANDAHYALQALKSNHYSTVGRVLDYVFYRGVAGYLVRPLRPILVLLALVTLLSAMRVFARRTEPAPEPQPRISLRRAAWTKGTRRCNDLFTCVLDTFSLVGPRRAAGSEPLALGQRLEAFGYRILVVCALLGLANSNPTLRQMVDTLF